MRTEDAVDIDRVRSWFVQHVGQVDGPLRLEPLTYGRSNLTYLVADGDRVRWVLRRPPLHGVVQSAHDVLREFRIMAALGPTPVPLPPMLASCDDPDVIGAQFFVMGFVDGTVLTDQECAERALTVDARARVGESLVDALADLHAVDPASIGLGDLGRGAGYVARQLDRWHGQLGRLGITPPPAMTDVLHRLRAAVPAQVDTVLLHGDFRPGNTIVGDDGRVRAVLDWELSTRGDPLADLGWLLAYWGTPEQQLPLSVPTRADGFGSRDQVARRYAERTGRDLGELDFYIAFALWRLAAILAGVQARTAAGGYGEQRRAEADAVGRRVEALVRAADDAARAAGR